MSRDTILVGPVACGGMDITLRIAINILLLVFLLPEIDQCTPNPCKNNGVCKKQEGTTYQCECTAGYEGKNCELRKYCSFLFCQYGLCLVLGACIITNNSVKV